MTIAESEKDRILTQELATGIFVVPRIKVAQIWRFIKHFADELPLRNIRPRLYPLAAVRIIIYRLRHQTILIRHHIRPAKVVGVNEAKRGGGTAPLPA